jgi:hypothetical protein
MLQNVMWISANMSQPFVSQGTSFEQNRIVLISFALWIDERRISQSWRWNWMEITYLESEYSISFREVSM